MEWNKKYLEMGSKGKKYIVTRTHKNGNETFKCSCPATSYRPYLVACKHIKRLKEKLRLYQKDLEEQDFLRTFTTVNNLKPNILCQRKKSMQVKQR